MSICFSEKFVNSQSAGSLMLLRVSTHPRSELADLSHKRADSKCVRLCGHSVSVAAPPVCCCAQHT